MKHFKRIKFGNNRGITIVWMALFMLPLLIMFAGLAIDLSYMYFVKNQLQVGADAASLAGVPKLTGENDDTTLNPNVLIQAEARQEAWKFACKNKAASAPIYLVTNAPADCNTPPAGTSLNSSNAATGDIIVGHWTTDTPPAGVVCEPAGAGVFCRATGSTGLSINAVKAVPRRTGATPGMPSVTVFWGQIFRMIGGDWSLMQAVSNAIATTNVPYIAPLPICLPSCDLKTPYITAWGYDDTQPDDPFPTCPEPQTDSILCTDPNLPPLSGGSNNVDMPVTPPGQAFYLASSNQADCPPKKPGLAWTNFKTNVCAASPACDMPTKDEVLPYILGTQKIDPKAICNKNICTTNGNISPLLKTFEDEFNKHKNEDNFINGTNVKGWRIFVPIVSNLSCGVAQQTCPGAQGGQANPYYLERFAEVVVTQVMTTGKHGIRLVGATACNSSNGCPTASEITDTFQCKEGPNMNVKTITRKVTAIGCQDCNLPLAGFGQGARLVK